ncbi:MAG: hypothetical protein A3J29_09950 [Acidobacteria bacterium RIFCSPLOWO2_12_FULL_67_14b]|nr:MAG: hypothetical protein A3J29_09950 [Acidobacteria bacterium RIFCSPLOWO2_12_FULL_67_14b]
MTSTPIVHRISRGLAVAACVAMTASCAGELARTGKSPAYLIIESLAAASGAETSLTFTSQLNSDVQTLVDQTIGGVTIKVPTVFNDSGRASFRLALKNPGSALSPTTPSTINEITITRYRVDFKRADGRNRPGEDVPYGFDGAVTVTVPAGGTATVGFDLVRHTMKFEPPLRNLINSGGLFQINTIADITFYGRDQAGNEVSVTGSITVNFGDFGDPS